MKKEAKRSEKVAESFKEETRGLKIFKEGRGKIGL